MASAILPDMRTSLFLLVLLVVLAACPSRSPEPEGNSATVPGEPAAARLVLPFILDDYPGALAQAQERDLPLFIETWAPW
jgi:hypothetical protein